MAITWRPYDQTLWCKAHAGTVENYGGMGGFFDHGMRWDDFLRRAYDAEDHPRMEALRAEILATGLRTNGNWHQNDPAGVPAWEDGAVFQASMRAWGDLMARRLVDRRRQGLLVRRLRLGGRSAGTGSSNQER